MTSDSYEIGLGNNDFETRKKAKEDFISFWNSQAKKLSWFKPWDKTLEWNPPFARWFVGGTLNATYNRQYIHHEKTPKKPATLW